MKPELKQHIVDTLDYLKDIPSINRLNIQQIEDHYHKMIQLLGEFIEIELNDEEEQDGTMTSWWLYEAVDKRIHEEVNEVQLTYDVESAEDFINYMIKEK